MGSKLLERAKRLIHRVGHRGSYLLFLSLVFLGYGYSLFFENNPRIHHVNLFIDPRLWGTAWLIVGAICIIQAFALQDRIAFALSASILVAWGLIMLASWLLTDTDPFGWLSACIWLGFAAITSIVSYWPEPRHFTIKDE